MTELLDHAILRLQELPPDRQDELALEILRLASADEESYQLSPEEKADLAEAEAEADRGEFATDAEVEAVFLKYRR